MRVSSTLSDLKQQYGDDLRIVWKDFVVHPQVATTAAMAACAAQRQGKFFEFEHKIWEKGWPNGSFKDISESVMSDIATELQLDMNRYKTDMASPECKARVDADMRALSTVGVHSTPSFFINGRFILGAAPIERFKALIDEEMKKADEAIGKGMKPEAYYPSLVLGGKKTVQ